MSTNGDLDPAMPAAGWTRPNDQPLTLFRIVGSVLQLVLVAICFEMLLGISDGIGVLLRLCLLAVVMLCVVARIGWLSLIAIQFSLLIQEPSQGQLNQAPLGVLWVMVAMLTIIAAMQLPQVHRAMTDRFLRAAGVVTSETHRQRTWLAASIGLAIQMLQLSLAVVFAIVVLMNVPIARQSGRWLESSVKSGQAFWPGTIWLVLLVALFVLAREVAWRNIERAQASLYLRSVRLIATYRDLMQFERERSKRNSHESASAPLAASQPSKFLLQKQSQMVDRTANHMTDSKDVT